MILGKGRTKTNRLLAKKLLFSTKNFYEVLTSTQVMDLYEMFEIHFCCFFHSFLLFNNWKVFVVQTRKNLIKIVSIHSSVVILCFYCQHIRHKAFNLRDETIWEFRYTPYSESFSFVYSLSEEE